MKLNNKGWGTMEMVLLASGLVLALFVAIFFISRLYGSFDKAIGDKRYMDLENVLENAAKRYVDDNNIEINGEYTLNYATLKDYINDFSDSDGNICDGYVMVTRPDNINLYKAFITCPNYETPKY